MTKLELAAALVERLPKLSAKDVNCAVRIVLSTLTNALAFGQRIEIRGFGSFSSNLKPARVARNPKSGAKVFVPGKKSPHFKPGKKLRSRVNAAASQKS